MQLDCTAMPLERNRRRDGYTYEERWTLQFEVTISEPGGNIIDRLINPPERRTP